MLLGAAGEAPPRATAGPPDDGALKAQPTIARDRRSGGTVASQPAAGPAQPWVRRRQRCTHAEAKSLARRLRRKLLGRPQALGLLNDALRQHTLTCAPPVRDASAAAGTGGADAPPPTAEESKQSERKLLAALSTILLGHSDGPGVGAAADSQVWRSPRICRRLPALPAAACTPATPMPGPQTVCVSS